MLVVLGFSALVLSASQQPDPTPASNRAASGKVIEVYRRAPGAVARFPRITDRVDVTKVDLTQRKLRDVALKDPQYRETRRYRGLPLRALVTGYKKAKGTDLILFHFANGVVVPWARTKTSMKKLDAWVVVAWKKRSGSWIKQFGQVPRNDEFFNDPRPIRFGANKVVSPSGSASTREGKTSLNPWRHVDTLIGIELIDRKAWEAQFAVSAEKSDADPTLGRGLRVFLNRCVYCHGVRDVGGDFGPDFARPLPITSYRKQKDIHLKVKVHRMDAFSRGLAMPPQKDIKDEEMAALIRYLESVGAEREEDPEYLP